MADNPRKKGLDRKRVSQQPHEQAYQRRKAKASRASSGTSDESNSNSAGRGRSSSGGRSSRNEE